LNEVTANQIAAGEVIERPASALKELIENSLDAGATQIDVVTRDGGKSLIEVVDNGIGMGREDALMSLERHATSKIRVAEDLYAVTSYGFRGEALPSIASVSRFTLRTHCAGDAVGCEIYVEGGRIRSVREVGMPVGTAIEVRHLFFNTPARQKFLRTRETELAHVERTLLYFGMAHPEVGFCIRHDDGVLKRWVSGQDLEGRMRSIWGEEWLRQMIPVEAKDDVYELVGYIGRPGVSRPDRHEEIIFVNRRAVDNRALHFGVIEGYQNALMRGQYPLAVLNLRCAPNLYDVNIHPTKREIRFHDEQRVRRFVVEAVRGAIYRFISRGDGRSEGKVLPLVVDLKGRRRLSSEGYFRSNKGDQSSALPILQRLDERKSDKGMSVEIAQRKPIKEGGDLIFPGVTLTGAGESFDGVQVGGVRVIGVLHRLYILAENEHGLVLIDQHAAHERVLFEKLMAEYEKGAVIVQGLLLPICIKVTPVEYDFIRLHEGSLRALGLMIHEFGSDAFIVDGLPSVIRAPASEAWIRMVLHDLQNEGGDRRRQRRLSEEVIARVACRRAVKANDVLGAENCEQLLRDLLKCDLPYCCPHGRPTMIQISLNELEKKFGRSL
jgi:DNA mismatch repair protein MutL